MLNFIVAAHIERFDRNAIAIFALHKCGRFHRFLPVEAAYGLLFDGYRGVADRDHAEQQRAAKSADRGSQRHEGKEHQRAAIAFKSGGFEQFDPGEPGGDAEAAPPSAPKTRPSRTSNAIFMAVFLGRFLGSMSAGPRVLSPPARTGSMQG
jgi:hypothetical protein